MKGNPRLLLAALLLATSFAAPANAQFNETGIGGALRRIPFFQLGEDEGDLPELEMYDLPAPLPEPDNAPPVFDPVTHVDPVSTFIWAHTVDITTVKAEDIHQYGMEVRRILAMRKLRYAGYYGSTGTVANLDGVNGHVHHLLAHLKRNEIQAMMATIRYAEGTIGQRGYHTGFNYNMLSDLSWHPMRVWGGSSASGAYQFMNTTWPRTAADLALNDFTPLSQDIGALYRLENRLRARGMTLDDVKDENFERVIHALAPEWASFPCGTHPSCPYGPTMSRYSFRGRPQPTKSMSALWDAYKNGRDGNLPKMGYSWYHFNEGTAEALRNFQHAYQVKPTGNFDAYTWNAVFDGRFGSWLPEEEPVVEEPAPAPTAFVPVSVHNVDFDAGKVGDVIGGYRVTSPFGPRKSPCAGCSSFHPAWDLATPIGTPVYAPFDGIEVTTFYTRASGHVLRFTHDGIEYSLLHMDRVMPGGYEKGWVMGYTGNTGLGTGPHVDIRARQDGQWVLPSREVVHFMLDPTAFHDVTPNPEPEYDTVPPEPAGEDEIERDENSEKPEIDLLEPSRNWLQRLLGM